MKVNYLPVFLMCDVVCFFVLHPVFMMFVVPVFAGRSNAPVVVRRFCDTWTVTNKQTNMSNALTRE